MNINELFPIFAGLVGFPALVAAGVNVAKYFNFLTDGQAPAVVFWVNIAGFVGVAVAYFTGNVESLSSLDAAFGDTATFLLSFVAFVSQLGFAKLYHAGLKGTPVIGKSYSDSPIE